ncbi:hypothetical protein F5Y18DRAFT_160438 [Xylariaceae sp. FL1019]|nr:hypothetical protein F5Y18DRAFT_160438 [Xylariaceae sp. FL1019]
MSTTVKDNDGAGIRFCKLCSKPIMSESAYKRHVNYCRRTLTKPKKRKRSCKSCHIAKAKCSFENPCTRCVSKCLFCEYEKPQASTPGNESSSENHDATMSEGSEGSGVGISVDEYLVEARQILPSLYTPTIQPPRTAVELREDLTQQASITIILEVMRGLPLTMTSMETLPRFFHRQSMETNLPGPVSTCMQISRLFLHRNTSPHDRATYLSALNEELARLIHTRPTASQTDLMAGLQVIQIYATMTALDSEALRTNQAPELGDEYPYYLMLYNRQLFTYDSYRAFDIDSIGQDNETWEEFIYAETRRRAGLFWFLQSRVLNIHGGFVTPPIMGYRGLALPAPDALWLARTREEWHAARARIRARGIQHGPYGTSMRTIGDLIDAQNAPFDSYYAEQRRQWLANSGKEEVLLLIGASMI